MRVAILEDDPDQAELVTHWLKDAGYTVFGYAESGDFLRAVRRDSYDLYLLDWVLPDLSGLAVLGKLRKEMDDFTPSIVATVKDDERCVVTALVAGADDYLVKPLRRAELLARVQAVLRRVGGSKSEETPLEAAPYEMDAATKSISLNGEGIALTNKEFDLARFFFRNAGKMLSRSHILEEIWGIDAKGISTRTVDTHVSRLRKKLKLKEENGWRLSSVYQHGYRIERVDAPAVSDHTS